MPFGNKIDLIIKFKYCNIESTVRYLLPAAQFGDQPRLHRLPDLVAGLSSALQKAGYMNASIMYKIT